MKRPVLKRLALTLLAASAAAAIAASQAAAWPSLPGLGGKRAPKAAAEPAVQLIPPAPGDYVQLDPESVMVIDTNKGRIYVQLVPELAPDSVARVKQLTREHFYDGLKFHRVIDAFMAQTGDPQANGLGGSKYPDVKGEFTFRRDQTMPLVDPVTAKGGAEGFLGVMPVKSQPDDLMEMTADHKVWSWSRFCPGVAGMARADNPNSANSQFFLMRQTFPTLDKDYTAFGRVVVGEQVVRSLKPGEPPKDPDVMTKVQMLADLPEDQRPKIFVLDPHSKAFGSIVAKAREDKGPDFTICDVEIPAVVK
jgi:peptidylprolyl isomerase